MSVATGRTTGEQHGPSRTGGAIAAIGTVADLELRQRVRSTSWYVLLGVSAALLLVVTLLLLGVAATVGRDGGPQVVSAIVFFVLLLGSLVTPALSGAAVNGDREAGTLATTQVTLVTTAQLVIGKFLAAWAASLAFLAVAVPFLLVAVVAGGVDLGVVAVALLVTAVELGVVAAIGVGLSALIPRTVFSVVTVYLVVAALSVGTLIAFGLGGVAAQSRIATVSRDYDSSQLDDDGNPLPGAVCATTRDTEVVPRFDRVWPLLAVNPYAVLADAVPSRWDASGNPVDLFGSLKAQVRTAQTPPADPRVDDYCSASFRALQDGRGVSPDAPERVVARTTPSWYLGLALQLVLAAAALVAGGLALRTPAKRLARGSRIA